MSNRQGAFISEILTAYRGRLLDKRRLFGSGRLLRNLRYLVESVNCSYLPF